MSDIRDLPDDHQWLPNTGFAPMVDLGELAARLESPMTYDRRGSVVLIDRCIHGRRLWDYLEDGTGATVRTVAGEHTFEPYSLGLKAGSDGAAQANISKALTPFGNYKFGIQFSFRFVSGGYILDIHYFYYTGTERLRAQIRININSLELQYFNDAGGHTKIATIKDLSANTRVWNTLKMVLDVENQVYMRALLNETEYPLTNIPINVDVDTTTVPYVRTTIVNQGAGGDNPDIFVNDFIFTVGEP